MGLTLLCRGLLIGLSIAAPVGPIGVLCIRKTLAQGRSSGLACGLGAAAADGVYGAIAGFGLTAVSNFLIGQLSLLRLVGGCILLWLGSQTFLAKPATEPAGQPTANLAGGFASTFLLTLTNPMTILSFVAVFAGLGLGTENPSYAAAGLLVLGVFLGSALWWILLSSVVGLIRERCQVSSLDWINRISGIIIVGFGLLALLA